MPGGRRSTLEGGSVTWDRATGATTVLHDERPLGRAALLRGDRGNPMRRSGDVGEGSTLDTADQADSPGMTPTRVGLLGLAAAGTTVTLLTRLFVQALKEIDVEIGLDPYGSRPRAASLSSRPAVSRP